MFSWCVFQLQNLSWCAPPGGRPLSGPPAGECLALRLPWAPKRPSCPEPCPHRTMPSCRMMRQAGRYQKAYRDLAAKHPSFRERSEVTDLIVEISLQPWNSFKPDGVIIFRCAATPKGTLWGTRGRCRVFWDLGGMKRLPVLFGGGWACVLHCGSVLRILEVLIAGQRSASRFGALQRHPDAADGVWDPV